MRKYKITKFSSVRKIFLIFSCFVLLFSAFAVFFAQPAHADQVESTAMGSKFTIDSESGKCTGDSFHIPATNLDIPNPISWFICGVTNAVGTGLNTLNSAIKELFNFNPIKDGGDNSPLYNIWKRMRDVANIFFILGLMIIVISQALDFSIFSNYTLKKMLPKLILGIVLANLSWVFCEIIINVFNLMGNLIGGFILQPAISALGGSGQEISPKLALDEPTHISLKGGTNVIIANIIANILIALMLNPGAAIFLILLIFIVGIIIAIIAFFVLAIRRVFIVVLIVLAPLACAAWALPSGEKLFSKWWKWFIDLMVMYVYIEIFIAMGVFIGAIMLSTPILKSDVGALEGILNQINSLIAFCVLLVPYAMIPVAFKMSSKTVGAVQGAMNAKIRQGARAGTQFAKNKGKERYNNSEFAMRRRHEKEVGQGAKQQRAEIQARQNVANGSNRRARRAQRNMTADDQAILQTQVAMDNLRVPQALEKQRQIALTSAAFDIAQAQQGMTFDEKTQDNHSRAAAIANMTDPAQAAIETEALQKIMASNKDTEGLSNFRDLLTAKGKGAAWNSGLSANFGEVRALSADLAKDVDTSKSLADNRATWHSSASFTGQTDATLSSMTAEGWQRFAAVDQVSARNAYARISANESISPNLSPQASVHLTGPPPPMPMVSPSGPEPSASGDALKRAVYLSQLPEPPTTP